MPAHSKDLTESTNFRHTAEERTIITNVVRAHAEAGITISRNDAIRILVRRAATPLPESIDTARDRYTAHVTACGPCTADKPGCPDGWWLADMWGALVASHTPTPRQGKVTPSWPAHSQAS